MDVRLPDGTVITNVPEGTTQSELQSRLGRMNAKPYKLELSNVPDSGGAAGYSLSGKGAQAGGLEQFVGGAKHALDRAAVGVRGLLPQGVQDAGDWISNKLPGHEAPPADLLKQGRAFVQQTGPLSTVGEIAGDVVTTGGAAGRALKAASALPRALRALAPAATGAGVGFVTQPEDRGMGAGAGAAGGVLGQFAQRAAGGLVKPLVTSDARELMAQGIQPTPGQAMSGANSNMLGRSLNSIEERMTSMPFVGEMVSKGRNRAVGEWNEALTGHAANYADGGVMMPREAARALVGKEGNPAGDEGLLALRDKIGNIYESTLEKIASVRIEHAPITNAVKAIADDPALGLSDASIKRLNAYVKKNLLDRGNDLTGKVAKRIESDLGKAAYRFQTGTVGEEAAYGEALKRLHTAWRESLEGALGHREAEALRGANAGWRGLQQIDKAGSYASSAARDGVYTPKVLRQAMKAQDKTQNDNAFREAMKAPVKGGQTPYDYTASMTRAGQSLGDSVPDSGTAGRMISNIGGMIGLGGGLATGTLPALIGGGVAAAGAYSRLGSQMLTQGLKPGFIEKVIADAAARGIPEEMILAQGPNFIRSLMNHYSNPQGQSE